MEDQALDGFTDGQEAAEHYDFIIQRLNDILGIPKRRRAFYRRVLITLGEDLIIEMLGHAMVFSEPGHERLHLEDHLEEMLADPDI